LYIKTWIILLIFEKKHYLCSHEEKNHYYRLPISSFSGSCLLTKQYAKSEHENMGTPCHRGEHRD
ncbi:MAG: hypothetical protein UHS32_00970, partial [Bacteroidaceae bacterium]|nr:hypothetical protein [Bacteroidaceae bacterium]